MDFELRQSLPEDAEFAFQTVKETMRDYAIQTWGDWHEKESKVDAIDKTKSGELQIITYEGKDIGTLQIKEHEDYIEINKLYILSKHQNKGIGTQVLAYLIEHSRNRKKRLNLEVLQVNRAKEFYSRMVFKIIKENKERQFLQYSTS